MNGIWVAASAVVFATSVSAASLTVDFSADCGRIKPLHGVNNAPVRVRWGVTQHEFAAAGIPVHAHA